MWLKVDHHLLDHDKWEVLEDDPVRWCRAVAVWVACGTMCSRLQTDGLIRVSRVRRLCPLDIGEVKAAIDDLVLAGLVVEQDGELWMHNFLRYNPSKAEQDAKRTGKSARNRKDYDVRRARLAESESKQKISNAEKPVQQVLKSDSAPLRTVPDRTDPFRTHTPETEVSASLEEHDLTQDLRARLKQSGATQRDLAAYLHVGNKTVSSWVSGKEAPDEHQRASIDTFLEATGKATGRKTDAARSQGKAYQDDVCRGFDVRFERATNSRPTWKVQHFTAIKRWRVAGRTLDQVMQRAEEMFRRHGAGEYPCKDGCDFSTLVRQFDILTPKRAAVHDIRVGRAPASSHEQHKLDDGVPF